MSRENVEIVRTLYELGGDPFNAAAGQVDQVFRDHLDEQLELRLPSDYPEGEPAVPRTRGGRGDVRHDR